MDEVMEFVLKVVPFLDPWVLDEAYYREFRQTVRLVNASVPGAAIYFRSERNPSRIGVSGQYPDGVYLSYEDRGRITVSVKREPARAAQDIQRRFVSAYLPRFKAMMEQAYRIAQQKMQAESVAEELAMLLGETVRPGRDVFSIWSQHGTFVVSPGSEEPHIRLERVYSLPPMLAVRIARVLAEEE